MGEVGEQVKVISRAMVPPFQSTPPHHFFLSCLDIFWQDIPYNRRLIFYESTGASGLDGHAALMQKLKSSLALCLVHYYPWCGRIARATLPPHRLFIDCNDAGVEFVEASADFPLSRLAQHRFQMKPFFLLLSQFPDHKGDSLYSSPLLSIQATLFSDGGLVLGIAQSHIVADGQSLWNFMVSWGECSRGVPLSLLPLHNRERLTVLNPSPEKASAWTLVLSEDKEEEAMEYKESTGGTEAPLGDKLNLEPLVECIFDLPSSAVKKLKGEAGEGFTSYEVLCAHFWQHVTVARQTPRCDPTSFAVLANCRTRVTPALSPAYFGNVIVFCSARSTAGRIGSEPLSATASRIHEVIARTREDRLISFMHYLEAHDNRIRDDRSSARKGKVLNVASSPRFPVYEVDFGWGTPVAVRPAKAGREGELVLFGGRPGSNQGDVEICTALPATVLRHLLEDPGFLAKPPCSPFIEEF